MWKPSVLRLLFNPEVPHGSERILYLLYTAIYIYISQYFQAYKIISKTNSTKSIKITSTHQRKTPDGLLFLGRTKLVQTCTSTRPLLSQDLPRYRPEHPLDDA